MRIHIKRNRIIGGTAAAAFGLSTLTALLSTTALAGGFAVREQSAEFQGMSFAGNAASGGGLSGMFWNPAVAAYAPAGFYSEAHYSAIFGHVDMTGTTFNAAGTALALDANSGNIAKDAIVPASYMSYRVNDKLVVALGINSPFGLVTEPSNRIWAGQAFARTSEIKTYNFTPTFAYRIAPNFSVGVGVQIERIEGRLKSAAGVTAPTQDVNTVVKGDDFAFGYVAGVNWTPSHSTSIGLGYRSSINHNLQGTIQNVPTPLGFQSAGMQAGINLPEIVTLSLRHAASERLTVLSSVEWSHWSRVEKLDIVCADNTTPSVLCGSTVNGKLITSLPLGWHDGWMFSVGGEWKHTDKLTLRSGIAYEISPVQDATARTQRLPDVDRLWASIGATYKWSDKIAFDVAYSHIFGIGDDGIDRTIGTGATALRFLGSVDSQVDIVSASLKVKLGDTPVVHEPMK